MEYITPPMPAKRALAALDQPAPADIGTPLSSTSVAASVTPLAWYQWRHAGDTWHPHPTMGHRRSGKQSALPRRG
jgi:hypothetical protein